MGLIQRDALRTMILSYVGLLLGYFNKGVLFILLFSTEQIGLVNLILIVGMMFALIANLGTVNTVLKFSHFFRNEQRSNYGFLKLMLIIVAIGTGITTAGVYILHPWLTNYFMQRSAAFVHYSNWIIPVGIANVFYMVFETYLKSLFKNILPVILNEVLLRLMLTFLLILFGFKLIDFNQFLITYCLIHFIPVVIVILYLIRLGEIKSLRAKVDIPNRFRKILINFGLFSYLNSVGAIAVVTLDTAMVASMVGLKGAGVYSIVIFLTSALMVPYKALYRISSPFVPVYWKERKMAEMDQLYKNVSGIGLIMGIVMFSLVWLNRVELFSLLKPEYAAGIWVFFFLMIGRLIDMYTGVNTTILLTSKKYRIDGVFTAILLCLVVGLNYLLIPIYGIIGAAISTMFALGTHNLLRLWYVWKAFGVHPFKLNHLWIFCIFVASLVLVEIIPEFSINFFINVGWHTLAFGILFVLPVLYFKLEPQLNEYIRKVLDKLRKP